MCSSSGCASVELQRALHEGLAVDLEQGKPADHSQAPVLAHL